MRNRLGAVPILLSALAVIAYPQANLRKPIVPAYGRTDEGPGKIQLLPGYLAGLPKGVSCVDSECGLIKNPHGLTIDYIKGPLPQDSWILRHRSAGRTTNGMERLISMARQFVMR